MSPPASLPEARRYDLPLPSAYSRLALLLILTVAAVLRFTALGWGLQHPPHVDEEPFVHHTLAMLGRGDFDHAYYEYPGLMFYILAVPGIGYRFTSAGKLG